MNGIAHESAGAYDSRLSSWIPEASSADAGLLNEAGIITSRARDLVRNNPVAAGVRQTLCDNIIGSQLRLSAQPCYRLLGQDKDWATQWGNFVEDQFATWADTTECDVSRTNTFLGLTTQALSGALVNGDAFALVMWQPRKNSPWATRLQIIESDRVNTPPWLTAQTNIRNGVELDSNGAPVAYWIMKNHPGDKYGYGYLAQQDQWERIPAFTPWGRRRVIHLYDKERSGQSRGKSVFASLMRDFKVLGDYLGSEVQAAASNALIASIIESDLPAELIAEMLGGEEGGIAGHFQAVVDALHRKKMEGGMNLVAPLGTSIKGFETNRPNTAFAAFTESVERTLGVGFNLPYELYKKDYSKSNYSSSRAASLEAWRHFYVKRSWLRDQWLDACYECWLEEAVGAGLIDAPDYYKNQYAYSRSRWIYAGRGWVDPVKESKAAQIRMDIGVSTLEQECAEQGQDWIEVLEQRARERAKMEELGLLQPYELVAATPYVDQTDPNAPVGTANA
ncbi:MAG: phage portal protein [Methylococcales bacterium]